MEDQRKYPRFDVVATIRVKKLDDGREIKDTFVKNISAEGFCFSSKERFKPGEAIEIEIVEKKTEVAPIRTKGEVVWSSENKDPEEAKSKGTFLTGVRVLGVRKTDEARFAMLYCERMLAELKSFLHM